MAASDAAGGVVGRVKERKIKERAAPKPAGALIFRFNYEKKEGIVMRQIVAACWTAKRRRELGFGNSRRPKEGGKKKARGGRDQRYIAA